MLVNITPENVLNDKLHGGTNTSTPRRESLKFIQENLFLCMV